jgi:hypothetical protein
MSPAACITTSWDDGHPLDLRVADLLAKHGVPGTFYTPMATTHGTMAAAGIRALSQAIEIGAHTLDHVVLTAVGDPLARRQIVESRLWLEDITGLPCRMFCPPTGRYARRHLVMVRNAGFLGLRSVELGSLEKPQLASGLMLMPTSVQAFPHTLLALSRNAVKRGAFGNLWRCIRYGGSGDWEAHCRALLGEAARRGGVFHLWGHSWELDQTGQWQRLETVLRMMGEFAAPMRRLTNGQICQAYLPPGANLATAEFSPAGKPTSWTS